MKIWNKVKYPLLLGLITVVMIWIRFLTMAVPSWVDTMLYYPLIALRFIVGDTWTNILLIAISAGAVMLVPCDRQWEQLHRFVLRPAVAVLVILCLSGLAIGQNDEWEDAYWDSKIDAYCQEVSTFLEEADEVILYSPFDHDYSPYFEDERIQCACGAFHNVIMIDYDTMRIAFLQHEWITDFYVYELEPGALAPGNGLKQMDTLIPQTQNRLITYTPGFDNGHRTSAIELILADGTVYSTSDTPDEHWDNAFLDLSSDSGDYIFLAGQPHPES